MKFDYGAEKIVVEIRPQVEVLNYTMMNVGLWSGDVKERKLIARKGSAVSLPFWTGGDLSITLEGYVTRESSAEKKYTIPLVS